MNNQHIYLIRDFIRNLFIKHFMHPSCSQEGGGRRQTAGGVVSQAILYQILPFQSTKIHKLNKFQLATNIPILQVTGAVFISR